MEKPHWHSIRWVLAAVGGVGVGMIVAGFYVENHSHYLAAFLFHLGVAYVVACVIGGIIEVGEFKDFFEQRLIGIFTGKQLVDILDNNHLLELHGKIIEGIARKTVTNPAHEYQDYVASVCNPLTAFASLRHRKNQAETIHYKILNDTELTKLGIDLMHLGNVGQTDVKLRYMIVSPKLTEPDKDEFGWSWWVSEIPGLPLDKHYEFSVSVDGKPHTPVTKEMVRKVKGTVVFDVDELLPFHGTAWVEARMTYYELGVQTVFQSTFGSLTHNASVHFASREPLELFARMFGVTDDAPDPSIAGNSVSIQYPGWILPDHGYYISLSKPESAQTKALEQPQAA